MKTMENIALHLKLIRGMRGIQLAYVVQCHISLDMMITRAPIINLRTNLKLSQESLDNIYLDHQCDTFKINNALVYKILLKMFMDMDVMTT